MPHIELERTFWHVGHGAFYTEEHIFRSSDKAFRAVYDCGGKSQKIICNRVDKFLDSVRDVKTKNRPTIDYLFISHFHRDHINGVCHLLNQASVQHIVVPQLEVSRLIEAYIYNALTMNVDDIDEDNAQIFIRRQLATHDIPVEQIIEVEPANDDYSNPEQSTNGYNTLVSSGKNIEVKDNSEPPYWVYIPINIDYDKEKRQKLIDKLNAICVANGILDVVVDGKIQWSSIDTILRTNMKGVKVTYEQLFTGNHNAYSMPVYSGPIEKVIKCHDVDFNGCDLIPYYMYRKYWHINERLHQYALKRMAPCLYMGDFEAKDSNNLCKLRKELNEYYYHIGMQQVPHHYSQNNHNIDLYEDRVIAFGNVDDHKDVSFCHSIYNEIQRETCFHPIVITENTPPLEFIARFWFR